MSPSSAIVTGVKFLAILWAGLAVGCASSNGAKSVITSTVRPIKGDAIKQVLLGSDVLSKMLGQAFEASPQWPSTFGGAETLGRPYRATSSPDCVGVALMTEEPTYQTANVQNVANEYWWTVAADGVVKVLSVSEGVVALPAAADATALFGKFSEQWNKCSGQTVTTDGGRVTFSYKISDVRVADSVVAATSLVELKAVDDPSVVTTRPEARAIGVRGNCLVEVDVAFFDPSNLSAKGNGDIDTSAIQLAHAMMDKVSGLS